MSVLSDQSSLEARILGFCLKYEFYQRVKNILDRSMFDGHWGEIWHIVVEAHARFEGNISHNELVSLFDTLNPALPDSARERYYEHLDAIDVDDSQAYDLQYEIVVDFWKRNQARLISEQAVKIYLGKSGEFGELQRLIESSTEDHIGDKATYTEVTGDLDDMLEQLQIDPEFKFNSHLFTEDNVEGLDRGHFGIIFARPETGKTTFCSFIAQGYIKNGFKVAYWGNEEPAIRTKLRIIQSFYGITRTELHKDRVSLRERMKTDIDPYLTVLDSVGTSIQEIDDWCKINKPDIVFVDQMDKVRIEGKFNRGDEKLKEIYIHGREIAKRNKCLVWAVSQASAEADGRMHIDYSLLDNSKTGKAGEADLIIGIGKQGDADVENTMRYLHISKNKQNGWHGTINSHIDIERGVYE